MSIDDRNKRSESTTQGLGPDLPYRVAEERHYTMGWTDAAGTLPELLHAASFAAWKHRGQKRKDAAGTPYINHPIRVAKLLATVGGVSDKVTLITALLHDTLEDTDTTPEEIRERFGENVLKRVQELTDDKSLPKQARKDLQVEKSRWLTYIAKQVKIADKIDNITDTILSPPAGWSVERRANYYDWAEKVVEECRGFNRPLEDLFDARLREARQTV